MSKLLSNLLILSFSFFVGCVIAPVRLGVRGAIVGGMKSGGAGKLAGGDLPKSPLVDDPGVLGCDEGKTSGANGGRVFL